MFSELFESVARPSSNRKRWAVAISVALQMICLLILVFVPLIYTRALPKAILNTDLVAFTGAVSHPTREAAPVKAGRHAARLFHDNVLTAPRHFPPHARVFEEPPLPPEMRLGEAALTASSGLDLLSVAPAPAERVSRPALPSPPQRVLLPSTIEAAKLISQVRPVYPVLAIQAHTQGEVVLHAVISKEGAVNELQVLSGHPLLVNAALDAVRQWRYRPTLLNGRAVEVETTITVKFVLGQ